MYSCWRIDSVGKDVAVGSLAIWLGAREPWIRRQSTNTFCTDKATNVSAA